MGYPMYEDLIFRERQPAILIFEEKQCDRYFDVTTTEKLAKSFLAILRERLNLGYFYETELPPELVPSDQMDMFKSNKIPLTEAEKAGKILEIEDLMRAGRLAYRFLNRRKQYEYEGFRIEYLEDLNNF